MRSSRLYGGAAYGSMEGGMHNLAGRRSPLAIAAVLALLMLPSPVLALGMFSPNSQSSRGSDAGPPISHLASSESRSVVTTVPTSGPLLTSNRLDSTRDRTATHSTSVANFTRTVLVETFTGVWCHYCPAVRV